MGLFLYDRDFRHEELKNAWRISDFANGRQLLADTLLSHPKKLKFP